MMFVELHNKILQVEKNLNRKEHELSHAQYEALDSYYPLGEALEKKLAEFASKHPLQTARVLLNKEIKRQFPSNTTRSVFDKKKRSARNVYKIFSVKGLGRDKIQRIRSYTPSSIGSFTSREIKIIQEKVGMFFSQQSKIRQNELEIQLDDMDLDEQGEQMLAD
jgi:hypothetical protein